MIDFDKAPIMVSGPGRSGSTWMQTFLSLHHDVHIHGQSPNIPWQAFNQWFGTLLRQGEWAAEANRQVGYTTPHYAGSDPYRTADIFRRMFRAYVSGYGPHLVRWGMKWIGLCSDSEAVGQWESLWPDTRWVVCLRDPFTTIESLTNTFEPELDAGEYARQWVEAARFALDRTPDRVALFRIDRLSAASHAERRGAIASVLDVIGIEWTGLLDDFVQRWPVVHRVKPHDARSFRLAPRQRVELLEKVQGLGEFIDLLGYERPA